MRTGLIGNEQNESDQKPPEADLHAIDAGGGVGHGQAVGRIIRRNQNVRYDPQAVLASIVRIKRLGTENAPASQSRLRISRANKRVAMLRTGKTYPMGWAV